MQGDITGFLKNKRRKVERAAMDLRHSVKPSSIEPLARDTGDYCKTADGGDGTKDWRGNCIPKSAKY
jgi:hypothetical protein